MTSDMVKAKSIFLRAIEELEPHQWPELLDAECADDVALRTQVEKLLQAHSNLGTYHAKVEENIAPTLDIAPIAEKVGMKIGRYKLVHELGHGGMGMVFMAVQKEPVKRKVALKIIKPGMDTKEVVARFNAERQALAMMDHQCIATVLDGGSTESGRPYFVMELVSGTPITEYCDECRFTTRQRLELFTKVCQAVQHAHLKGVIHRDIKPSNILVTTDGTVAIPKVIDFGIAKAVHQPLTDASVYTNVQQMVGTPLYMSPEQAQRAAQDVDTRTDVYSLGVLLYELLTGTTPFDKERFQESGLDEVKRIIREEEPPKPSTRLSTLGETAVALDTISETHHTDLRTLTQELTGELDWIVMKALEKDRSRRYESASDFAKDVQRYLDDEPVEACPPSTAYRLGKFYRRNKVMLLTAAVVALALIVGAGIAGWQAVVATKAKDFAKEQQQIAQQKSESSEKNFQLAFDAVDQMLTEIADEQLKDIPQAEPVRKALLEKALTFYAIFLEERGDDPEVQLEAAKAQRRAGDILTLLGESERAEKHYRGAIELLASFDDESDNIRIAWHAKLECLNPLAILLRDMARVAEAKEVFDQALLLGRRLVREFPAEPDYRCAVNVTLGALGQLRRVEGQTEEAERFYREAIEAGTALVKDHPQEVMHSRNLSKAYDDLGTLMLDTGRMQEADAAHDKALKIKRRLVTDFPESSRDLESLAVSLVNLGSCREDSGQTTGAETCYVEAIEILQGLSRDFPHVPRYLHSLSVGLNGLGIIHKITGHPDKAEECFGEAITTCRELVRDFPNVPQYRSTLSMLYLNQAGLLKEMGRPREAEPLVMELLAIREQLLRDFPAVDQHHRLLATSHNIYGTLLASLGRKEEALTSQAKAVEIYTRLAEESRSITLYRENLAICKRGLGSVLRDLDRSREADVAYEDALDIFESLASEFPSVRSYLKYFLNDVHEFGWRLLDQGRFEKAEEVHQRALAVLDELGEDKFVEPWAGWVTHTERDLRTIARRWARHKVEESPEDAQLRYGYAVLSAENGQFAEAIVQLDEAIRLDATNADYYIERASAHNASGSFQNAVDDSNRALELDAECAQAYAARATARTLLGEYAEAERDRTKAVRLAPESADIRVSLGMTYAFAGRLDDAIDSFTEAIRLVPEYSLAYAERGFAYAELGDHEKAQADWQEAIRLDSACDGHYVRHGNGLRDANLLDRAVEAYTKAVQLNPENATAFRARAKAHLEQAQFDEAIADNQEAIRIDPKALSSMDGLLAAYGKQGDLDGAIAAFSELIEQDPNKCSFYTRRARAYRQKGDRELAIQDLDEAIGIGSSYRRNHYCIRAEDRRALGQYDMALADYQTAIDLDPENDANGFKRTTAFLRRGDIYLDDLQQPDKAIAEYTKAIELDPENPDFYQKRGDAYQAMGDSEKAEADFQEAIPLCVRAVELAGSSAARLCAARLLHLGAVDEYRQACAKILERFGDSEDVNDLARAAFVCMLGRDAVSDPMMPVELAQKVVSLHSNLRTWHIRHLGMAHFRAGQLEEAERDLLRSMEMEPEWTKHFLNWLSLALVHHRAGELEEAREWRDKAVEYIQQHPEDYRNAPDIDKIQSDLLFREAERLLGPPDQPKDNTEPEQEE